MACECIETIDHRVHGGNARSARGVAGCAVLAPQPPQQGQLQGESDPIEWAAGGAHAAGETAVDELWLDSIDRHVNVCREHADRQCKQSEGRELAGTWVKHAESEHELGSTAGPVCQLGVGEPVGDDRLEEVRLGKVGKSGTDEDRACCDC